MQPLPWLNQIVSSPLLPAWIIPTPLYSMHSAVTDALFIDYYVYVLSKRLTTSFAACRYAALVRMHGVGMKH